MRLVHGLAPLLFLSSLAVAQVKVGDDVLLGSRFDLVRGKRVGIVTNQTGRLSTGEFLVDALRANGVVVTALFGPEHGIRGTAAPGAKVVDSVDAATGIPVYSLYGPTQKPSRKMLDDVDVLLYDIQDVGARFYTYISTLALTMEAAAEKGIPFIVLDRPDPLGGEIVDGPLLEDSLKSFVGMFPIPVVYGLTCGELACMINGEGWLAGGVKADLHVVEMEGWRRGMTWKETGIPWTAPSPNIPFPATVFAYPVTCFLEATNVSEGRGTTNPFVMIGAPFINGDSLASALNACHLPGLHWVPASFTPQASKHTGILCHGAMVEVQDMQQLHPVAAGAWLLYTLARQYPGQFQVRWETLARLAGTHMLDAIARGERDPSTLRAAWEKELETYGERAQKYQRYQ